MHAILGNLVGVALGCLLLVSGGCASTPQASPERDVESKRFLTHPGYAGIYVYRPDAASPDLDNSVLHVDDRLIGSTLPGAFFRIDVLPGAHVVRSSTAGTSEIRVDTRPGELYFVRLNIIAGNSQLSAVPPETAKRAIRECCALMENWAPGQRPLLR